MKTTKREIRILNEILENTLNISIESFERLGGGIYIETTTKEFIEISYPRYSKIGEKDMFINTYNKNIEVSEFDKVIKRVNRQERLRKILNKK